MSPKNMNKGAVVGLGRMGLRHLEVLRELSFEIVGAADTKEAPRQAAAENFNLASSVIFSDAQRMLESTCPDLLVVATTAPTHCPLVCMGAEAGVKMILCEKPMAVSLAQCDQMIEVCKRTNTLLAINHQMRFTEQFRLPKSLLDSQKLGGLTSMIVKAGNFGLANNGSHYFEMFGQMAEEPPLKVVGWLSREKVPNPRGPEFEDSGGAVRIETASGKRFYMDAGAEQGHGLATTYLGRYGRIEVDELAGQVEIVCRLEEHRDAPSTRYGMPWEREQYEIAPSSSTEPTLRLVKAMLTGKPIPDGETGRTSVSVLVAAHVSTEQGNRTVDLSTEILPHDRSFAWA